MSDSAFEQLVIATLREVKEEIIAVGSIAEQALTVSSQTYNEAKKTNGRVTDLEAFKAAHTDVHLRDMANLREAESYAAGAQSERARAKSILARIWGAIRTPVLAGLFAGVTAAAGWLVIQLSDVAPW